MNWIALATYRADGTSRPGVTLDDRVYDLEAAARAARLALRDEWARGGVKAMLDDWPRASRWLQDAEKPLRAAIADAKLAVVPDALQRLEAPFRAERIFCAASNYIEHANEMGTVLAAKAESKPYMFLKLRNTVLAPNGVIRMPPETAQLDWEIELAAVIGATCRRIPAERALDAVAGYSIVNDI